MATPIHIVPVGPAVPIDLLDDLAAALARAFRVSCHLRTGDPMDAAFAFDARRNQYHATAILRAFATSAPTDARIIGVTKLDLFVPILSFVFGEAELGGHCSLVSLHRLDERFYGLPARPTLLRDRLIKEAIHELGHTFGLRHCDDWQCVMTSSHTVTKLDVKTYRFCGACKREIDRAQALCSEARRGLR